MVTTVGIIPAAGYATRLQPLDCSKEVYLVRGRPVMDHVLERMRAAGAADVRVVTRPDKADVIHNAELHGTTVVRGRPSTLAASLSLGLEGVRDDAIVLLGFPDTVWEPLEGYVPLVSAVRSGDWGVALGLFPAPDPEACDVVVTGADGRVVRIEVKCGAPSSNLIWGCAAARAGALRGIGQTADPGEHFHRLAQEGAVLGVRISDTFLDIGKGRDVLDTLA